MVRMGEGMGGDSSSGTAKTGPILFQRRGLGQKERSHKPETTRRNAFVSIDLLLNTTLCYPIPNGPHLNLIIKP